MTTVFSLFLILYKLLKIVLKKMYLCVCVCVCDDSLSSFLKLVRISERLWCYLTSAVLSVDIHHHDTCSACIRMCTCQIEACELDYSCFFYIKGFYLASVVP